MKPTGAKKKHPFVDLAAKLSLFVISLLFWLGVAEISFRVIPSPVRGEFLNQRFNRTHPSTATLLEEHEKYGKWNKPLAEAWMERLEYRMFVKINSKGLRDQEIDYAKPAGKKRILFIGDSFTYGTGVTPEESFVKRMETLNRGNIEAINGGAPSTATMRQVLFLREEGLRYHPDLVVLCFFQNDVQDNLDQQPPSEAGMKLPKKPFVNRAVNKINFLLEKTLYGRSAIFAAISFTKRNYLLPYTISKAEFNVTKVSLDQMDSLTRANQIPLAVVYLPRREELTKPLSPALIPSILGAYFKEKGIPYLNLYEKFQGREDRSKIYFPYDTHFTSYGHQVVAEEIQEFLKVEE